MNDCLRPYRSALAIGAAALAMAVGFCWSAKSQTPSSNNPAGGVAGSNSSPSEATIVLTTNQLDSIKIAPVAVHDFSVEKHAVGSITFDEDPGIVQAESTLLGAAAASALTSNELARVQGLGQTNGIAAKELEQALSDAQTAAASVKTARDALRALGKTDAQIDQLIAAGKISSGADTPGSSEWVLASVLEGDSPSIHPGEPVKVMVLALPDRPLNGQVSKVYGIIDPNLHRLSIRCELADATNDLRPGMLAEVAVQVAPPVSSPAVPANGVVREGDGSMTIWVTTDRQHFNQRVVQTGLREDAQVQILGGVQPGELVVTDGAIFLDNMLQAPPSD